jgi:hypothetical protein
VVVHVLGGVACAVLAVSPSARTCQPPYLPTYLPTYLPPTDTRAYSSSFFFPYVCVRVYVCASGVVGPTKVEAAVAPAAPPAAVPADKGAGDGTGGVSPSDIVRACVCVCVCACVYWALAPSVAMYRHSH